MVSRKVSTLLALGLLVATSSTEAQTDAEIEEAISIFNRGKSLHQERNYEGAIREYRAAIKLDTGNPFVYNALGLAQAAVSDFKGSLASFEQALQLNPDLTDVYNNMGMVYAQSGERDKAFEAYGRAVRNPNYLTPEKALYNIGNLYLEDGNTELAMMHYKRAVEKQPEFALGYRGLGHVYLLMGDQDGAMRQYQKALELFENDSESLYQLARIHEEKGESAEATELYRRVVEVDRLSPFGKLALQSLDTLKGGS